MLHRWPFLQKGLVFINIMRVLHRVIFLLIFYLIFQISQIFQQENIHPVENKFNLTLNVENSENKNYVKLFKYIECKLKKILTIISFIVNYGFVELNVTLLQPFQKLVLLYSIFKITNDFLYIKARVFDTNSEKWHLFLFAFPQE